jgi:4-diphosphocytidyl-2-C-methyl-D-erythritol kinase
MKSLFDVPAPAKLNLFLHVVGRQADGYHQLQSVFMLIDWHDVLHFEVRKDGQVSRYDLTVPLPEQDLVTRAAQALKMATGCPLGVHVSIDKQIPTQAGLGGGSSDAATCLLALNRLWGLGLNRAQLSAIGLTLGADVPFFLCGHNAWVEGVGEKLTPVALPSQALLVVKPPAGIDTASIFRSPALKRDSKPATIAVFAADPFGFGRNDLQPVAEAMFADVEKALAWLSDNGLHGRMSGSGSAVFALCAPTEPVAESPPGWLVRRCSNLDVHPLYGWASSDN